MYSYPLYRPPSEANSLIIQVTEGCSHNKCRFCTMYKDKSFKVKSYEEIERHIMGLKSMYGEIDKIFLADGNIMCLSVDRLLKILNVVNKEFPNVKRISAYAGPKDLLNKTEEALKQIYDAGLTLLYVGLESGDNEVLDGVDKGVNQQQLIEGCLKAKAANYKLSVMFISGLGGKRLSKEHAHHSAVVVNAIKPDYLSLLSLLLEDSEVVKELYHVYGFEELSPQQVLEETLQFLKEVELEGTVFRMNHASNYLSLKGELNKDKNRLIKEIEQALAADNYKESYLRRL